MFLDTSWIHFGQRFKQLMGFGAGNRSAVEGEVSCHFFIYQRGRGPTLAVAIISVTIRNSRPLLPARPRPVSDNGRRLFVVIIRFLS